MKHIYMPKSKHREIIKRKGFISTTLHNVNTKQHYNTFEKLFKQIAWILVALFAGFLVFHFKTFESLVLEQCKNNPTTR